jgi:hypothetical protein
LKSHGLEKRAVVNSIVNRTLISDETNGKIKNKAPADYLISKEIFPSSAKDALFAPHFVELDATEAMSKATRTLSDADLAVIYESFCRARERAIVAEIRKACGVLGAAKA